MPQQYLICVVPAVCRADPLVGTCAQEINIYLFFNSSSVECVHVFQDIHVGERNKTQPRAPRNLLEYDTVKSGLRSIVDTLQRVEPSQIRCFLANGPALDGHETYLSLREVSIVELGRTDTTPSPRYLYLPPYLYVSPPTAHDTGTAVQQCPFVHSKGRLNHGGGDVPCFMCTHTSLFCTWLRMLSPNRTTTWFR